MKCQLCGGPIRSDSTTGVCRRSPECASESARRWAQANPDYWRDRYRSRSDVREMHQRASSAWKAANPDKVRSLKRKHAASAREYSREYRRRHAEKISAATKEWFRSNPEKASHYARERRAREKGAVGRCSVEQLRWRVEMFGGRCYVAGCSKSCEAIDHVVPLSAGGTNWPANLRPICKSHNSQKKNGEWRKWVSS